MKDKKTKKTERKATLNLDGHQLGSVSSLNVGDTVTLEITAKLKRKSEGSYGCGDPDCEICGDEENRVDATFEISKISRKGESSKEAQVGQKYNELIRKGIKPSEAMKKAMKG